MNIKEFIKKFLPEPPAPKTERPKVGIALSGGIIWSLSHIGVLEVIEENNIPIDIVSGTSGGSLIGALWCGGMKAKDIEKVALNTTWNDILKLNFIPKKGVASNKGLAEFIKGNIGDLTFEQLKKTLRVVAVNLSKNQKHVFNSGSVITAVRASCAIPGFFEPVEINKDSFVDGTLVEKVPARTLHDEGVRRIISVCFSGVAAPGPVKGIIDILIRSFDVAQSMLDIDCRRVSTVLISPSVEGLSRVSFNDTAQLVLNGRAAALEALPLLKKLNTTI